MLKKIFNKNTTTVCVLLLFFLFFSLFAVNDKFALFDNLVQNFIISIRNFYLSSFMLTITHTGGAIFLIILTIILLMFIKNKKYPLFISLNLICSYSLNELAKVIFRRDRPIGINLINENSYSYPSGHSMVSMAYYLFLVYLIRKYVKNNKIKNILTIILAINIFLVGFSRIYLGVHYLSDVLGGFLFGVIYLFIYIKIINIEKK